MQSFTSDQTLSMHVSPPAAVPLNIYSFIHSYILYSFIHSHIFIYILSFFHSYILYIHKLINSFIYTCIQSLVVKCLLCLAYLLNSTHSYIHAFKYSFKYQIFIYQKFIYSNIHSFQYSLIRSFIRACIQSAEVKCLIYQSYHEDSSAPTILLRRKNFSKDSENIQICHLLFEC